MSAGTASSGGGSNRYEPPKKNNPVVEFVKGGGFVGAAVRGIKKSAAKSKAKKEANVEMGLGTDRMSNYSTGQGGTRQEGGGNNNGGDGALVEIAKGNVPGAVKKIVVAPKPITPTEAEVSQSAATDVVEDTIETRKKKTKAKGRSATILSSARGVRSDEGLTLGKRSLLGS